MDDDRIDHLLGNEDSIDPSPGFAAAVMEAVRSEAADRDRLGFPWRLTWPALAGVGVCTAVSISSVFSPAAVPITTSSGPDIVEHCSRAPSISERARQRGGSCSRVSSPC
jgi:hypothetical protein